MTQHDDKQYPTPERAPEPRDTAISASLASEASSAHSRLNIPLNLENWKHLNPEHQEDLLWFHQHCLDARLSLKEAAQALCYDQSTVFRCLKGTYAGNYANVVAAIGGYRKIQADRAAIHRAAFAENSISRLIFAALDYAMANNSITLISGESGLGKSFTCEQWRERNNHGRTVMVEIPPIGGTKAFLRVLCDAVGVNKNLAQDQALEGLLRAFNPNRMLILDEARRLLPGDTRGDVNPAKLEVVRYLHDRTKCAVALVATQRFDDTLRKLSYQYEQVLGRIGQPVRLFRSVEEKDFGPIIAQYWPRPSAKLNAAVHEVVNAAGSGHIRLLAELLKVSSRIATKAKQELREEHFFKAIALRHQMMGETQYARKDAKAA